MTTETLAPYVTVAVLALLAGWVPLLKAVASAWRNIQNVLRSQVRNEEAATAITDTPVREFSA